MPPAVNEAKNNILRIELPYHNLKNENTDAGGNPDTNWVIFWGANFKDLPDIDNEEKLNKSYLAKLSKMYPKTVQKKVKRFL